MSAKIDELKAAIRAQASVNDPFLGEGSAAAFEAGSMLWPGERWSKIEPFATTASGDRRLEEYRYTPADGGPVLPVAFMFEQAASGSRVRVYSDHHLVEDRAPILDVVERLHPWRDSNDETFRGRDGLRTDFSKMMGTSGIRIRYCRLTDDAKTCAVECYMPSGRPAVAVYERGGPGRLKAVRIYL